MSRSALAGCLLLLWLCFARSAFAQSPAGLRRLALIVAANDGGASREPLRFAVRDAGALGEVLEQLGGIEARDAHRLSQPSRTRLVQAFRELADEVRELERPDLRVEVVFYYSGHSDESALLLGEERVTYRELRELLDSLPVDVRIAILDSCASGAFTRVKGGVRRAPFLLDASSQVRGHAFLTSASADEAAQESDRLGGSFFTHFLVTGLRGAADASGDRKVTLTEAYRFAFDETLARTSQTRFGSQHPAYEIRLAGTGDLVMTDLRATSAELVLSAELAGRLFVWDSSRTLIAELQKVSGRMLRLALPPGRYKLELAQSARFFVADARANVGSPLTVPATAFVQVEREATLARGVMEQLDVRPFAASLIPPFSTNAGTHGRPILNHLGVALLYDDPELVAGLQLGLIGMAARRRVAGLQLAGVFTDTRELLGIQLGGAGNVARETAQGLQLTLGVNRVGEVLTGVQAALGLNYAGELTGAQLAFALNAGSAVRGMQAASINWASLLRGLQVGGLNLAREVRGLQVGLLNVSVGRVQGLQTGLVNYADEADVSIAPLGITRKGGAHVLAGASDVAALELALRLEANYNYTFLRLAQAPFSRHGGATYQLGAGVGAKVPLLTGRLYLDLDLGVHLVQPWIRWDRGLINSLWQLRAITRYQLFDRLGFYLGASLNFLLQRGLEDRLDPGFLRRHELLAADARHQLALWPGLLAGVRL